MGIGKRGVSDMKSLKYKCERVLYVNDCLRAGQIVDVELLPTLFVPVGVPFIKTLIH